MPSSTSLSSAGAAQALRASSASSEGHLLHASSFRPRRSQWQEHAAGRRLLARTHGRITRRFAPARTAPALTVQVARLRRGISSNSCCRAPVLLVQVDPDVEASFHPWRVGQRRRWIGWHWAVGAPLGAIARFIERAIAAGHSVAAAFEDLEACGK